MQYVETRSQLALAVLVTDLRRRPRSDCVNCQAVAVFLMLHGVWFLTSVLSSVRSLRIAARIAIFFDFPAATSRS